jgi:hypothetical protein
VATPSIFQEKDCTSGARPLAIKLILDPASCMSPLSRVRPQSYSSCLAASDEHYDVSTSIPDYCVLELQLPGKLRNY